MALHSKNEPNATNFYKALPYSVRYNGRTWRLTPSFDNVLKMYEAINGCTEREQLDLMLYYLLKSHRYPLDPNLLEVICETLFKKQKRNTKTEKCFDYIQDSALIYSAFWQSYGIDLNAERGKMHWWKFESLMQGLPNNTKLSEIISIRLKPIPKPTKYNQEERQELIRLKQEVALELSAEEREKNLQKGLMKMAQFMMSMATKNEKKS